jgi:hypothetical protein
MAVISLSTEPVSLSFRQFQQFDSLRSELTALVVGSDGPQHQSPHRSDNSEVDFSEYMTFSQFAAIQCLYFMQKASLFSFIFIVNSCFIAATLLRIFKSFWRVRWTLWSEKVACGHVQHCSSQLTSSHEGVFADLLLETF